MSNNLNILPCIERRVLIEHRLGIQPNGYHIAFIQITYSLRSNKPINPIITICPSYVGNPSLFSRKALLIKPCLRGLNIKDLPKDKLPPLPISEL